MGTKEAVTLVSAAKEGAPSRDPFPKISAKRARRIQSHLRKAADALGLYDWIVKYDPLPRSADDYDPNDYCIAEVTDRQIRITFLPLMLDADPEEQRQILAHELSHCLTYPVTAMIELLPKAVKEESLPFVVAAFNHSEEVVTQTISILILSKLPLQKL